MDVEEIVSQLEEERENYFKLRFQFSTGQLQDYTQLRFARQEIARLATILREKEMALGEGEDEE